MWNCICRSEVSVAIDGSFTNLLFDQNREMYVM